MYFLIKRVLLHVIFPIFLGVFIYLVYRSDSILFIKWLDNTILHDFLKCLKDSFAGFEIYIPKLILNSLPDGVMVYSATSLMLMIWNCDLSKKTALLWIFTPFIVAVIFELFQFFKLFPGTFSVSDMLFYLLGFVLPFIICKDYMKNNN